MGNALNRAIKEDLDSLFPNPEEFIIKLLNDFLIHIIENSYVHNIKICDSHSFSGLYVYNILCQN